MNITTDWKEILKTELEKSYYKKLYSFLENEYNSQNIFPEKENIFNFLNLTPLSKVKVVILGQDPYHNQHQAHGLSFSVKENVTIPPSLINIYKEIGLEYSCDKKRNSGDLTFLAKQGVLLMNAVLTVREKTPNSHKNQGWEIFTDNIISIINSKETPCVFILWGNAAKAKASLITNPIHLVLTGVHPSPLSASRGFFGCKHFKKTNEFLVSEGMAEINWLG